MATEPKAFTVASPAVDPRNAPVAPVVRTKVDPATLKADELDVAEMKRNQDAYDLAAEARARQAAIDRPTPGPHTQPPGPILPDRPKRVKVEDTPMVTVSIPKQFTMIDDEGHEVTYMPGVRDIPVTHADHWYARANGVTTKK